MTSTPPSIPPVRYLVLWLTTACNLRCVYCYRGDQPVLTLPVETARKAILLAAASGNPFHVQMAGGEPTLELKLVAAVARMVRRSSPSATLAVQTNGTLIDKNFIDVCRSTGMTVGVSLDGPPTVQNRLRGKAGATFGGLELLARYGIPVRVTSVLSALNVAHLDELVLSLAAFPNVRGMGLDPVVRKGAALVSRVSTPSPEALREGVRRMHAVLREVNRLRKLPIRWREEEAVRGALAGERTERAFCHACRGESLAVSPDGTVYPCSQTVRDPAMAAGTVDRVDWDRLGTLYSGVRLRGDCPRCPLEGRCPGDCPSRLTYNTGVSPHPMCLVYRTVLECVGKRMTHENTTDQLFQRDSDGAPLPEPWCVAIP